VAANNEYNHRLHWDIVDALDYVFSDAEFRAVFVRALPGLGFLQRKQLLRTKRIEREVVFPGGGSVHRADVVAGNTCFEVQCSSIDPAEVVAREGVYRRHGKATLWILGVSDATSPVLELHVPPHLGKAALQEMRQSVHRLEGRITAKWAGEGPGPTGEWFLNKTINVPGAFRAYKWMLNLLRSHTAVALYHREHFFFEFATVRLFETITSANTTAPYRGLSALLVPVGEGAPPALPPQSGAEASIS
jgi:hypothetical protein